jgi:hypothetical protein
MKLEKMSHWLTIFGHLGLLVGIALVGVQIEQNSQLTRVQLSVARWSDDLNLHLAMMGENPAAVVAKAIENPSELSVEDAQVLEAYRLYWGLANVRRVYMYEMGMDDIPPPTFELDDSRTDLAIAVLGNRYMKATHDEIGIGGPLVAPKLQVLMSSLTGNENWEHHERVMERIKEAEMR